MGATLCVIWGHKFFKTSKKGRNVVVDSCVDCKLPINKLFKTPFSYPIGSVIHEVNEIDDADEIEAISNCANYYILVKHEAENE